jgi:hypothetical protein
VLVEASQDKRASHAIYHGRVNTNGGDCKFSQGSRWLCHQQHSAEGCERNENRCPEHEQANPIIPWRHGHGEAVQTETKPCDEPHYSG